VIAMQVRDQNTCDLTDIEVAANELVLRAFAAVEKPDFAALFQAERDRRYVACSRRHAGAGPEKGYLHLTAY
jgi:hypothetical protein